MSVAALHILIEYHGCELDILNDPERVRTLMLEAVRRSKATIVTDVFHTFSPQGVSGVIVIAESHVTIHTWPEHGYAAVDVFTCGASIQHQEIIDGLKTGFGARKLAILKVSRGHKPLILNREETPPPQLYPVTKPPRPPEI